LAETRLANMSNIIKKKLGLTHKRDWKNYDP